MRLRVPLTDSGAPHLILQRRAFKAEAFGGNIILVGRQFRTHAIVMFCSSLTGRSNLVASLYNLSATWDVSA